MTATTIREPSEAAWKRSGEVAARILTNLAIRRAEAEARERAALLTPSSEKAGVAS